MADDLMTTQQVAKHLDVSDRTLERWRHLRVGPRYIQRGRFIRYKRSDVEAWLEDGAVHQLRKP